MTENCDKSEEERVTRLAQKQQRAKMQPLPCAVCGKVNEYEKEGQQLAKQRKRMVVLRNDRTKNPHIW